MKNLSSHVLYQFTAVSLSCAYDHGDDSAARARGAAIEKRR